MYSCHYAIPWLEVLEEVHLSIFQQRNPFTLSTEYNVAFLQILSGSLLDYSIIHPVQKANIILQLPWTGWILWTRPDPPIKILIVLCRIDTKKYIGFVGLVSIGHAGISIPVASSCMRRWEFTLGIYKALLREASHGVQSKVQVGCKEYLLQSAPEPWKITPFQSWYKFLAQVLVLVLCPRFLVYNLE